jgi:hypothetical protein
MYQIRAEDIRQATGGDQGEDAIRAAILRVIEPIAGEVRLERYEPVRDAQGKLVAYDAWATRQ